MRKRVNFGYEIYFKNASIDTEAWNLYLNHLAKFIGFGRSFQILITFQFNKVQYFLSSPVSIPKSFNTGDFLIKEVNEPILNNAKRFGYYFFDVSNNLVDLANQFYKKNKEVKMIVIRFRGFTKVLRHQVYVFYEKKGTLYYQKVIGVIPSLFLAVDFQSNPGYFYQKIPKYFKIDKILHLLSTESQDALFQVDTFPYLDSHFYLRHDCYDFWNHSLVIGSSGCGKSKFLAHLIANICHYQNGQYKIVVIDPHDALKRDLWQIPNHQVVDFKTNDSSVDLFQNSLEDRNAVVELSLSLLKNLISDGYNSKLERVLRFSIYLLIMKNEFSFYHLRNLLLDMDYRNGLIRDLKNELPASISYFFLTEFNELKTTSYNEAIAPIISFIDEMQMIPVFNEQKAGSSVGEVIQNHLLTIFSLNRLTLGDKVTKTIAGFIMQQIFLLAESGVIQEHLILVIDEVAVLENPILARFLSELRKFHTSVILAGQYFHQISDNLRESILANTSNYYLFRVSKTDALMLTENLDFKLEVDDSKENRCHYLTNLKNRECVVRLSKNGTNYPVFKGVTTNYLVPPYQEEKIKKERQEKEKETFQFHFTIGDVDVHDVMKQNSSSRKKVS